MPQFAVFRNPGRNVADIPFVVQVQSTRLDDSAFRVVMALPRSLPRSPSNLRLHPHFMVQGQSVFVDPLNIVTLRRVLLGEPLETLAEQDQDAVAAAIDEMISRA